jgi:hypothetical protein
MLNKIVSIPKNNNNEKSERNGRINFQIVASMEVVGRVITKPIQEMSRIKMVAVVNAPTRP